jgi:hypothetical protein
MIYEIKTRFISRVLCFKLMLHALQLNGASQGTMIFVTKAGKINISVITILLPYQHCSSFL